MNVVVHGYEELSTGGGAAANEEEEKAAVSDFIRTQLGVADPSIVSAARLGRPRTDRPRPLRITFADSRKRLTTLNAARTLSALPATNKFRQIFIKPDFTKLQREQDFLRRRARRTAGVTRPALLSSDNSQPL